MNVVQRMLCSVLVAGSLSAALIVVSLPSTARAGESKSAAAAPSLEQLSGWVADLDSSSFAAREAASRRLVQAGTAAISLLAAQAESGGEGRALSLERIDRTLAILSTSCNEGSRETALAALGAIERLSRAADKRLAQHARAALGREKTRQQQMAIQTIERLGAQVQASDGEEENPFGDAVDPETARTLSVRLNAAWRGGDAGVAELAAISGIQTLSFEDSRVTDAALPHLAGLKDVEQLFLGPSHMRAADLSPLAGLPALRHLSLRRLSLANSAYEQLGRLTRLDSVGLDDTPLGDAELTELARLTALRLVWLNGTRVTDAGLPKLAALENLTHLELAHTRIDGSGLAALKPLARLRFLSLEDTQLDDRGASQLGELTQLTSLGLDHSKLTDAGLGDIAKLVNLETLWLSGTAITDAGLTKLGGLKQLRALHLEETAGVTEAGIAALSRLLPELDITL